MCASPASTVTAPIAGPAAGARFGTVTANVCDAVRPPGSRAVTVTAAVPPDTPVTVTAEPATAAVATPGAEETAEYASASPSGSPKCSEASTVCASPASTVTVPIAGPAAGARFGGGAVTDSSPPQAEKRTRPSAR